MYGQLRTYFGLCCTLVRRWGAGCTSGVFLCHGASWINDLFHWCAPLFSYALTLEYSSCWEICNGGDQIELQKLCNWIHAVFCELCYSLFPLPTYWSYLLHFLKPGSSYPSLLCLHQFSQSGNEIGTQWRNAKVQEEMTTSHFYWLRYTCLHLLLSFWQGVYLMGE